MLFDRVLISDSTAYTVDVLPEPVGPGDEDRALRRVERGHEARLFVGDEAEARQVERVADRVEQAQDHRLAGRGRHGHDAHVDRPALDLNENRPSCAMRFCAMSRLARIFNRLTSGRRT